jgi:type IV pilus assembly protein PilM
MRIVGIDLGSQSVKAVEIESAFGRFEIQEYHEARVQPEDTPAQTAARILAGLPKPADRVVVGLPSGKTTFRNFQLPTKDKKAIQAGVGFELDDEIPFPLDQAVYDYSLLNQTKNASQVHVCATLKRHLAEFLGSLKAAGIDPDLVTSEAWALRTHLNRVLARSTQEQPVLIVDIGHSRTLIYGHWRGAPILAREIPWGGKDLTLAICQRYEIPWDEAEKAKTDRGFVLPKSESIAATEEQEAFSNTLRDALQELLHETRRAELTCKSIAHENLSHIYLSGGTSLLPGLPKLLEENLLIPIRPLQALTSVAPSGITYSEQTDACFLNATALALCLVGQDKRATITLRKNEFAKAGTAKEFNWSNLRGPLLAAGTITASLFLSLGVQSQVYKRQLEEVDQSLEKSIKGFFGQISSSGLKSYLTDTSLLKKNVKKELTKQQDQVRLYGENNKSPIDFLKTLSASIGKDKVVDLIQFQVGSSASYLSSETPTASLTFLVSNPQVADQLAQALGKSLDSLQKSKPEEVAGTEAGTKKWKVTLSGKPTESAYVK